MPNFEFSVDKFLNALPIMGKGMLGIFVVTIVIILVVSALNAITSGRKDEK